VQFLNQFKEAIKAEKIAARKAVSLDAAPLSRSGRGENSG